MNELKHGFRVVKRALQRLINLRQKHIELSFLHSSIFND